MGKGKGKAKSSGDGGGPVSVEVGHFQIPHPGKKNKKGEDSIYISGDLHCFGVFDGVGGWAEEGVDASKYSNGLATSCKIGYEREHLLHPTDLLEYAYQHCKDIVGTSTGCVGIIAGRKLSICCLGDSRIVVVRNGQVELQTAEQQVKFNMPYQMGTGSTITPQKDSDNYSINLKRGDFVVAATDGLFDNLIMKSLVSVLSSPKANNPKQCAQECAQRAYKNSINHFKNSPFSKQATSQGFQWSGGKPDDISVIICKIT